MAVVSISLTAFILYSTLLFFGMIFAFLKPKRSTKHDTFSLPPGPKPWPFIGCGVQLLLKKPVFRWIHDSMAERKVGIMCIKFGNTHIIPVTSSAIAREFLKRRDAIFSSRPICMSADVTSGGYLSTAFTPMGQQWKKMRRIVSSQLLSPARHRWLQEKRDEEANHLIRFVYSHCERSSASGNLVNVRATSQHFCANVIRQMIFSKRFFGNGTANGGPGVEEVEHVAALFTILSYIYSFCVSDYFPFLRFLDLDGREKIIRQAVASATKYQDPEIDERIQQWKNGMKTEHDDLLDILITLKDTDGCPLLTAEEIKSQITELMIATVDNPSNAVEWALAEMLNQPELLERATSEIDRVVGRERFVQESDLPKLNYVKACLKESFRLHPIAPFNVPHVSTADTVVAGFFIPTGSHVILSRPGLGRDSDEWDAPLTYRPERHITDDGSEVMLSHDSDLRMLSFSTGRRGCAGVLLGSTLTTMLFARLLQGFTWGLPPDVSRIELKESAHDLLLEKPLIALAKPRLNQQIYTSL